MPIPPLKVIIEGDVKDFSSSMKRATKDMNNFSKTVDNNLGKSTKSLNRNIGGTTSVLTSFSQVVQDAPYGIRGVANNIEQLVAQFGALSKSAGGSGKALGGLFKSLIGPAGILIAVSAVSAAMVKWGDQIGTLSSIIDKLQGHNRDLADSLNAVSQAAAESVAEARTEEATLRSLISIARDHNETLEVRQNAINTINKEYPKLHNNLSLENVATQEVTTSLDKYTQSLIRAARAQAIQSQLAEQYTKILNAQNTQAVDQTNILDKLSALGVKLQGSQESLVNILQAAGFERSTKAVEDANKEIERLLQLLDSTQRQQQREGDILFNKKSAKEARTEIQAISTDIQSIGSDLADIFTKGAKDFRNEYLKAASEISQRLSGPEFLDVLRRAGQGPSIPTVEGNFERLETPLRRVVDDAEQFSDLMANAIAGIARDFSRSFRSLASETGATFGSVFNGVINAIGVSITDVLVAGFADQLKNVISDFGEDMGKATQGILAGVGLLGGLLQNLGRGGQILGGGLQGAVGGFAVGAATGLVAGPIGAAIGGAIGLLGGIFGSNKKQEALEQQQLDEMRRARAYTQDIIGKYVEGLGVVEGIGLDTHGELTARIAGKDIEFTLEQARSSGLRGI